MGFSMYTATVILDEIQSKLKAIYNVVEMLSNIIRDGKSVSDLEDQLRERSPDRRRKSISIERIDVSKKYNYVHYDPELHWCRTCDVFPKTAKDLLLHLQSEDHKKIAQERDMKDDTPWHHLPGEPELPYYEGAPKKRLPIKGLQFFIPAPAWYCKLCDTWIGDLHCASQHLKSQTHSQNYSNFVEQNPHWEIEWLKDRERALARTASKKLSESDDNEEAKKKKHKSSEVVFKDKKKKKRSKKRKHHSSDSSSSSSSSSDSSSGEENTDKSRSIRVAMRNMKVQAIMNEDLGSKWEMLGRLMDEHKKKEESLQQPKQSPKEDRLINQWNVVSEPQDKDKKLLDSLKDRMKQKHEAEKAKYEEMERKQKERERLEREQQEQKEREEKAAKEREEELKRMKERQELERIRDRDREQVKFRTKEKPRSPPPPRHYRDSRDTRDSRSSSTERHRERRRENGRSSNDRRRSRSRSRSPGDRSKRERKPPPPPSINKRLPFIGRMPLFKNKKPEEKVEKEIKKEDYDIPRQTRFEPGHLLRAFIPEPEVVCFPKLSSIPPITIPPPAPPQISTPKAPPPPKIGEDQKEKERKAKEEKEKKEMEEKKKKAEEEKQKANEFNASNYQMEQNMMAQYQYDYSMMYQQQMYDYSQNLDDELVPEDPSLIPPLEPPPLPPDDPNEDLAMLGLSADDMAVQTF